MAKPPWPKPSVGQILYAKFPYWEYPNTPGPKPRPCLVLAVHEPADEDGPYRVQITYGTGQKANDPVASTDLVVSPVDRVAFAKSGLMETTRFQLDRTVIVEYTQTWFSIPANRPHGLTPKLGALDRKRYAADVARAAQAAGISTAPAARPARP